VSWILSQEEIGDVPQEGTQDGKAIPDPPGTPREVGHEDLAPGAHQAPGELGEGSGRLPASSDGVPEPRRNPVQNRAGGFRCHVSGPEPRSPCGEDYVHLPTVRPSQEEWYDGVRFIGYRSPQDHLMALPNAPLLDDGAASVLPLPSAACIRNGEDAEPEGRSSLLLQRFMEPSV